MSIEDRIAGAPISWGVCEVPGWGHQMQPGRVLTEMREVGLVATEFGPDGFLSHDPVVRAETLLRHGLRGVGGFAPVVLHDADRDVMRLVSPTLDAFVAASATTLVLSADSGRAGYDERIELDAGQWSTLFANLDRISDAAAERGVTATLHPHVGTVVERREDVHRVLDGSVIPLCLDTGHLLIGGTDPVELVTQAPERVAHCHLKDVDASVAAEVSKGALTYSQAVAANMYRPLGQGDVDIAGIVRGLEASGYQGWYVMEQDSMLSREPDPGAGPVSDVLASLDFLRGVAA